MYDSNNEKYRKSRGDEDEEKKGYDVWSKWKRKSQKLFTVREAQL